MRAVTRLPVVVLVSGRGSNLKALIDASTGDSAFAIRAVISNRGSAAALKLAEDAGIEIQVVDHDAFPDRISFDQALGDAIETFAPGLVVLAGFMRILSEGFVARFAGRLINVHPSLLPEFRGLETHRRALEAGVAEHGASVHFVTAELDGGPVVAQARVTVRPDDDPETLAARVLAREHDVLPVVVDWFASGRLVLDGDIARLDGRMIEHALEC